MPRVLFVLVIIYLILTLIGCLDEFATVSRAQNASRTSAANSKNREPNLDVQLLKGPVPAAASGAITAQEVQSTCCR
ncbi:MAG TPA: hypothetical protein VK968_18240 [Roseimicrobium sp.]|nr:hypothetical protein [Roseimicrobium sp.]